MDASLPKTRLRRVTCAVAAVAAAAALTACSTENEDATPDSGATEQTQAAEGEGEVSEENAAPKAPLSELILTGEEVPGLNFEPLGPDGMMQDLVSQVPDDVEFQPAECKEFANYGGEDSAGLELRMSGYEDNSKLAGVSLSSDVELAGKAPQLVSQCPHYSFEADLSDFVKEQTANSGYEITPEIEQMLGPDFGKTSQDISVSGVEAEAPEGVDKFFAFYIEGTESAMGQEFPVAKLQLVGVVDGVFVSAYGAPFSGLDPETGELMGNPQVVDKEAYQAKAEEVFAAQVEKIRNA